MANVVYSNIAFTSLDERLSVDVSSEKLSHRFTNIDNFQNRFKTWRTDGYWLIDSTNKDLVFNDGASNFTATLDEGEYRSDAEFFAEIKEQMEDVGGQEYTISRNNQTKKIEIASDGGTFEIVWTDAANTMADLLGFDDTSDSTGDTSYEADFIALHTEEFVVYDFGAAVNPQYLAILGLANEDIALSETAVVKAQFSMTDNFAAPGFEIDLDYSPDGLFVWDIDGMADQPYRYMKVKIVDRDNANGFIELSTISAGSALDIERGRVQFPLQINAIDATRTVQSAAGSTVSDERSAASIIGLAWFNLSIEDKEKLDIHFTKTFKTARAFFVFIDPESFVTSSVARASYFVKYLTPPSTTLITKGPVWSANHQLRLQV